MFLMLQKTLNLIASCLYESWSYFAFNTSMYAESLKDTRHIAVVQTGVGRCGVGE